MDPASSKRGWLGNLNFPSIMNINELDPTIETLLLQASDEEAQQLFDNLMRHSARMGLLRAMEVEVNLLCGEKHKPVADQEFRRAGSETGVAFINGEKHEIKRPRVRSVDGERSQEAQLETYRLASQQTNLFEQITNAVAAGATMRGLEGCNGGAVKKSQASEMWVEASLEVFQEFRYRPLSGDWIAIILDGVFLGNDKCAIVAIGIEADGSKQVLDFELGASENATTCITLLERIVERGFGPCEGRRLIALCDGSKALRKAVFRLWPDVIYQECLVHVQRVVTDKLAKKYHEEIKTLFSKLRNAQGEQDSKEAFDELCTWIEGRNKQAALNLRERKDSLIAFQSLNLPTTLNTTFLSTNIIENVFRNFRAHTKGVKRWKNDAMINRWVSTGLLKAESGFNKVSGYKDIPLLLDAVKKQEGTSAK